MKSSAFLAFCASLLLLSCQSQEWQKVRIEPKSYPETNETFDYYVRGHISEIVRSENFNLFDEADFDNISRE